MRKRNRIACSFVFKLLGALYIWRNYLAAPIATGNYLTGRNIKKLSLAGVNSQYRNHNRSMVALYVAQRIRTQLVKNLNSSVEVVKSTKRI